MKTLTTDHTRRFDEQPATLETPRPIRRQRPKAAALAAGLSGLLLLASQASASVFSFSTGNPDGKVATLIRPSSPGTIETETADDFILTTNTLINQATFTGLIVQPAGSPLARVGNVRVEIYRVFPNDSKNPPSGNVPSRTNSPADVELVDAARDGAAGTLRFTSTLLNASFPADNSVVTNIHQFPPQFTGGEGRVSGQEVVITVVFHPPISLPPDHYFFVPTVQLSSGDFLWLSAPKPIVAPGTPFTDPSKDLQSWIRNEVLAPDWLRIGTDITKQGPFNAAFSLSGETDLDDDGVPDSLDHCPGTPTGAIVNAQGCSIEQLVPCAGPATGGTWKNHGQYVSAIAHVTKEFRKEGLITQKEESRIKSLAARSDCGKK